MWQNPCCLPLHRPQREPGDEAVQEHVVDERDGDGDKGGGGHQGLPEEDIAPDQFSGDADRDRLLVG